MLLAHAFMTLVIRTKGDAGGIASAARQVIQRLDNVSLNSPPTISALYSKEKNGK